MQNFYSLYIKSYSKKNSDIIMTLHVTTSLIPCARFELAWGHDPTYSEYCSKHYSHQNNKLFEYRTYTSKQTFTAHLQIIVSSASVVNSKYSKFFTNLS